MKKLQTQRLLLREIRLDDYQAIYDNWASDDEVTKYLSWDTHINSQITYKIVENWVKEYQCSNCYRWAIVLKENNDLIGMIGIEAHIKQNPEIGYVLSRRYWNNGYMTEALRAVCTELFSNGYNKLLIKADVENIASNKVIIKNNFIFEKTINEQVKGKNCLYNCYYKLARHSNYIPIADVDMLVLDKFEQEK